MGKSLRPSERGGERGDGARKTTRAEKTEDEKNEGADEKALETGEWESH